jgi:nanoRNase/pAp phosphatase (c-di-AMP/oligoRNAs hydrolase)
MTNKKENKTLNLISTAKTVAIVPSKVAGADSFSAAVGLYYMLLEKEKDVYFIYQGKVPEETKNLVDKDRISSNVAQREVIITVDYSGTSAGQAHYSTEGDVLEIRLGPVPKDFDIDRIRTKLTGFDFDLIIVLGAQEVGDLGSTYTKLKEEFAEAKVINIDNTKRNKRFGDVNVVDATASTLSVLVFTKAAEWGLIPTEKAAQALLTGMTYRSGSFGVDNR